VQSGEQEQEGEERQHQVGRERERLRVEELGDEHEPAKEHRDEHVAAGSHLEQLEPEHDREQRDTRVAVRKGPLRHDHRPQSGEEEQAEQSAAGQQAGARDRGEAVDGGNREERDDRCGQMPGVWCHRCRDGEHEHSRAGRVERTFGEGILHAGLPNSARAVRQRSACRAPCPGSITSPGSRSP
jgi:hypothetical protein